MSESVILGLISSIAGIVTAVISGMLAYYLARLKHDSEQAALAVKEVAATLKVTTKETDDKLEDIQKTGNAVHVLVNSAMSSQLRVSAVALRRIADLTKHPDDAAAADLAENAHREHEMKQHVVDAGNKITTAAPEGAQP